MLPSSDFQPSSFSPQPSPDPLSPFFFTGFLRLLYWTFFKPSAYYDYVHSILGEDADKKGSRPFLASLKRPLIRRLSLVVLLQAVTTSAAYSVTAGLLISPERFNLSSVAVGVAGGVVFGVIVGVVYGAAYGAVASATVGVAVGVVVVVALGMVGGVTGGLIAGAAFGTARDMAFSVALGMVGGVTLSVVAGVALSVAAGLSLNVVIVVAFSVAGGLDRDLAGIGAMGVAYLIGVLRLPVYLFQSASSLVLRSSKPEAALRRSPAIWDELMILPQPGLAGILRAVSGTDLAGGLRVCGQIVANPFQRWSVQRALHGWLATQLDQTYRAFELLFSQPEPYRTPGQSYPETQRKRQPDFTTRLILGELAGRSPIPGITDRLARTMTAPLRDRKPSPVKALAAAYYELLEDESWDNNRLETFAHFRSAQHGEETYQTFRTLDDFLERTSLDSLSTADAETTWLQDVQDPLRSVTLGAINHLADVSRFVRNYRAHTSAIGKRDALTLASVSADMVRKIAENIKSPERILVARVAQQWFDLITVEQAKLAAPREVRRIRNMYLVGPPVRPDSGHPFVGRHDQFQYIKNMWADANLKEPVILHGQRRMGKTSILHHLEKNLGPAYISIFTNLQSLALVDNTSAFTFNLCDEIQRRLRKANIKLPPPQRDDFAEPFTGLRRFLNQIEDRIEDGRWLVLMLDEFEMIEDKIKEGAIRQDVLYQFRDAMLNRPRLAIVLAGLHTLDEMTRDYWSPFFSGSRNVKVSYLGPDAAETLITNPWDGFELEYDREAVELVASVTGCQPTLLQSVCSALIDRVNTRLEKEGPQYSPRIAVEDVKAVLDEVQETGTYFDAVWKELDDKERLVLAGLAEVQSHREPPAACAEVESKLRGRLSQAEIERAWELLRKRDMIVIENGQASFQVELVRRWVRSQKPLSELLKAEQVP